MLVRVGMWCFRNRAAAALIWVVAVVGLVGVAFAVGTRDPGATGSQNSESQLGFDVFGEHFAGVGSGESGTIVFRAERGVRSPLVSGALHDVFDQVAEFDDVLAVASPYNTDGQISADGTIAFAEIAMADVSFDRTSAIGEEIARLLPEIDGVDIELGGEAFAVFEPPESELIGLAFAVIVLIFAFGSVLAMGLPIGVAVAGVGAGISLTGLYSNIATVPTFASTLGAMIGLGVGIDYALFIVTRYREELHDGREPPAAMEVAMRTAARAVIFAGLTVVVSLSGLLLIGLPFIAGIGVSAAVTVLITMAASVTLLPALLGMAGMRVEITRSGGLIAAMLAAVALFFVGIGQASFAAGPALIAVGVMIGRFFIPSLRTIVDPPEAPATEASGWYRWSRFVQARPWSVALLTSAVLVMLTIPVFSLRLGFPDEGNYPEERTTRRAYDLLVDGFGPGFNGPILVVVDLEGNDAEIVAPLAAQLAEVDGLAEVSPPIPNDPTGPDAVFFRLISQTSPQSAETASLIRELRDTVIPAAAVPDPASVYVTGTVAASLDFSDFLASRTLLFFGVVLALSFLLLMMVFRSVLVPLKAVIMNVLSIGAAYGVVIATFQWGWGEGFAGIPAGGPIEPFLPMMLFAIVFGLSMDYEVFLLSRMRESYEETGDPVDSVAEGLASTARVITAAAAIMVVVFGSFLLESDRTVKVFGAGLAVAVFLDATLVRMLLVPATMQLLGGRNWWFPAWLDKVLPSITVEQDLADVELIVDRAPAATE